ncbi:pre-B-cell leukemia homeobox interacting protein 1b [Neosynchiropus ocellatus]
MSGTGSPNTWTIVSPEETETLRPLAEETEQREQEKHSTDVQGVKAGGDPADASPVLEPLHQDVVKDELTSASGAVSDVTISSSPSHDAPCQSEDAAGDSSLNTDSFSDSWSHMTLTPDEPSGSLMTPETLVGSESTPQHDSTSHPENEEEVPSGEEGAHLSSLNEPADCTVGSHAPADEPELRRRTLERIGRTEEEEEVEEDFQLPRREEESWLTLNKCILGAVLLVGLGTIFLSGVFMDLDEESDRVSGELKDAEVSGKQSQELKVSPALAAEGAAERLHGEEESSGLRKTMETLSLLQKENERMRRELESVPGLQEEVNTLKSAVTELKRPTAPQSSSTSTTSPSGGQPENSHEDAASEEFQAEKVKDRKKGKHDKREKKQWEEHGRTHREEEREWKNEKLDKGKENKQKSHKEWKQKERRGDDGKPWKDRENEEWDEKRDRKDKRQWRKHEKPDGGSYKSKDNGEDSRERNDYRMKKDWHREERTDHGQERKDKRERKEWRREGEERRLKEDRDRKQWKEGEGKDKRKERGERYGKGRDERKHWEEGERYGKGRDEGRKQWDEGERYGKGRDEGERYGKGRDEGRKQWDEGESFGKGRDERKRWDEGERYGKGRDEKKKDMREHYREERKHWKEDEWRSRKGDRENDNGKKNERKDWEGGKETWRGNEAKQWRDKGMKRGEDHDPAVEGRNEKWERKEESWSKERKKHDGDWKKDRTFQKHAKEEPAHSHRRLSLDEPEYWSHQRGRLQGNPKPRDLCSSLEACAQAEGLLPVPLSEFQTVLQTYLSKAEQFGVESAKRDELFKLAAEFFKDGLFVHDQMRFQDFADDVSDILEDLVEGDEEDDSALEDEMEDFGKEVVRRFLAAEKREKGERKKESGRARG